MISKKIDSILNDTKQLSDELKLKLNLGKAELEDELEELESSYELLKSKIEKIADVAGDSAEELRVAAELGIKGDSKEDRETALELAAEELKDGYKKIKKLI